MRRKYDNDWPSVTTILSVLRKIGLENYFKWNTPDFIKTESGKAKTIGSIAHEAIQKHIENEKIEIETEYPEEVRNAIKSFFLFKKENPEIKLKKAEMQVCSQVYGFNGTLDCLAEEERELILADWTTSNAKKEEKPIIYPEKEYQVSAYVKAYNEQEKANIERARVLVFAKDKICYNTIILEKNALKEMFEEVFLSCLKIWNYQKRR